MSTIAQLEVTIPRRNVRRSLSLSDSVPVWRLALGWVMLIPMIYIAANGTFILSSGDVDLAATGQTPGSSVSHKISVALVSLICTGLIALRFAPVYSLGRRMWLMLAFPLLAILSASWSADPQQSVVSGFILLIFTSFVIYVASRFSFQRQFELIMLAGAIAVPASVALAVFVPSIGATEAGWRGLFGHKQTCAAVSTFWLITALHWKCFGVYQKMFRAMYVVLCALLIIMSKSRTGWALALVALLLTGVIWLLQSMPAKQALALLLLVLAAIAASLYEIHLYAPRILASVGKDSTLSERTLIWSAAWAAISQHPILGYGFASFWKGLYGSSQSVVLMAGWGLEQAQDGFLDVLLGMGAVGLALIALLTAQATRNAVLSFYSKGNKAYVRWCIVVIVSILIYNIGESSIGLLNMSWFLFLLAAIGLHQAVYSNQI
jgi:exopolysaccharide production protein ExoQ